MTAEQVMVRFVLAYLGTFTVVAVFFLAFGVLIGCWVGAAWQERRADASKLGLGSWDTSSWATESGTVFEPGVVKVGEQ